MSEPGAKGGISVKEAAEVCFICYIVCYDICYITCYRYAAWPFAREDREAPGLLYRKDVDLFDTVYIDAICHGSHAISHY